MIIPERGGTMGAVLDNRVAHLQDKGGTEPLLNGVARMLMSA